MKLLVHEILNAIKQRRLSYLRRRTVSKSTRRRYNRILIEFAYFVYSKYGVQSLWDITQDHYADYIRQLHKRGLKKTTINAWYKQALLHLTKSLNLQFKVSTRRVKNGQAIQHKKSQPAEIRSKDDFKKHQQRICNT